MSRSPKIRPLKLYPIVLREIADLIEAGRVKEVNVEALEEVSEYVKKRQTKTGFSVASSHFQV